MAQLTSEQLDTILIRKLLRILVDSNIETQANCVFWRSFQHDRSTHDVSLVYGTNVDTGDLQECSTRQGDRPRHAYWNLAVL